MNDKFMLPGSSCSNKGSICKGEVWCIGEVERITGKPEYRRGNAESQTRKESRGEYCILLYKLCQVLTLSQKSLEESFRNFKKETTKSGY